MIENYWDLEFNPFQNVLSDACYYDAPMHQEALARLFYLIEERHRCGLLTGQTGVGKSRLLRMVKQQTLRTQRQVVLLDTYAVDGQELLWRTLGELGQGNHSREPRTVLWRMLSDHFYGASTARQHTVLLFDHLPHASADAILFVERLLHLPTCTRGWVSIIFAADQAELNRVPTGLKEHLDLSVSLKPLDGYHTAEYVRHVLRQAGTDKTLFSDATMHHLYETTGGIPRQINHQCNLALLNAMTSGLKSIDPQVIHSASNERIAVHA